MTPVDCWVKHSVGNVVLSVAILIGLVLSYTPQHMRIVRLGTSHGLSPYYLLMGALSGYSNLMNAVLLQSPYMACCKRVSTAQCFLNLLGFLQLLTQWAMFFVIFILFIVYFPEDEKYVTITDAQEDSQQNGMTAEWKVSLVAASIVVGYMMITGMAVLLMTLMAGKLAMERAATLLGSASLLLSLCQFIPQLTRTYKLKQAGALSVSAMSMQAPGSFIFCYALAVSPGTNVTTWMTYFVGGILQTMLLMLCIYYHNRRDNPHDVIIVDDSDASTHDAQ